MKDLDFDELDKAVNSLMSSSRQLDKPESAQAPQTLPAQNSEPEPAVEQVVVEQTQTSSPEPARAPTVGTSPVVTQPERPAAPAARRGGRFMDMVSTPASQKTQPAPITSREGLSITPRTNSATFQSQTAAPIAAEQSAAAPTPDPITPVESNQAEPEESPDATDLQAATEPTLVIPAESPFIADAKVEKRPLNAGAPSAPLVDLSAALQEGSNDQPQDPTVDEPAETENGNDEPPIAPQVAELDSNLVAIESNENSIGTQAAGASDATTALEQPSTPLGATSIPQQYTSQPSSGDQSHAAIYDSSQYPEPVAHPAKSKSGWLWVLWVILLLGIGAGGAVVLYNLGII